MDRCTYNLPRCIDLSLLTLPSPSHDPSRTPNSQLPYYRPLPEATRQPGMGGVCQSRLASGCARTLAGADDMYGPITEQQVTHRRRRQSAELYSVLLVCWRFLKVGWMDMCVYHICICVCFVVRTLITNVAHCHSSAIPPIADAYFLRWGPLNKQTCNSHPYIYIYIYIYIYEELFSKMR